MATNDGRREQNKRAFSTKPGAFEIQAHDALAVPTIDKWIRLATEAGVPFGKLRRAEAHRNVIARWQEANPKLVKRPD